MTEKIVDLEKISLLEFFGVNEKNLSFLSILFPLVQLVLRGNSLKIIGKEKDIEEFYNSYSQLENLYHSEGYLDERLIMSVIKPSNINIKYSENNSDILVHGRNGNIIKARTPNQKLMVEAIDENDMLFALGPAGSGKTYTAVALAVRALKSKKVKRIILTRPAVEAGENLGFLPGDLKDKLDPYLQPLYDALRDMILQQKLESYIEDKTIEIAPLAFMRGRTLDNCFVILDEAQNATYSQMKMFLTRMGKNSKFIITGDPTQTDLPKQQVSGLINAVEFLRDIKGISFVHLKEFDIIRHPLVTKIVEAYNKNEN
ncbi:MAG: PhoH family protein [Bacteroidales bacterium]|jgi:phosphate starvation-inducible PhoH-like protein|nr:PhoH family protein [Bacteroidales bacterium]